MCLIYNPDAAAVLLPRGHTVTAVSDPARVGLFLYCRRRATRPASTELPPKDPKSASFMVQASGG